MLSFLHWRNSYGLYSYVLGYAGTYPRAFLSPRTGLEFTCNLLNLPFEVRDSQDDMLMRYTYLSDVVRSFCVMTAATGQGLCRKQTDDLC